MSENYAWLTENITHTYLDVIASGYTVRWPLKEKQDKKERWLIEKFE
jgi:hypothetical protein